MRITLATVVLTLVCGVASAQTLAHSIPDDVLFYARSENPLKLMEDLAESPLLWKQPQDFHTRFIDGMDRLMSMADGFIGIEVGSMSTYLNSVTAAEGALFGLELTDSMPEIDFVLVLDTPQAKRIYDVFSGILVKKELAERDGESEIDVSIADEFTARIGRYGDKIIVASRPERLREVMDRIGSVMPGSLAQSKSFKACVDSIEGPGCMYVNLVPILELIHEEIPSRQREWFDGVASPLGFWKMAAAGWREGENSSRAALKMGEKVLALDMFAGASGPPDMLGLAPSDAAIAVCWPGELAPVWRKSSAFFLDPALFPYADRAEEGIRSLQKMLGFRFEEIAALASGGILACFVPTVMEVDDDEAWLGVLRVDDGARAQEVAQAILEQAPRRKGAEVRMTEEAGVTWMVVDDESVRRRVCLAVLDDYVVAGLQPVVAKGVAVLQRSAPSLGQTGALKGLRSKATLHGFVGLKGIFALENDFNLAYHSVNDHAGVAFSLEVTADRVVLTTNRPVREFSTTMMLASGVQQASRRQSRAVRKELKKIHTAWKEYRGKHGKDPRTLSQLGLTDGENALVDPQKKEDGWKSYALIPNDDPPDERGGWGQILAYYKPTTYGRIVVYRGEDAWAVTPSERNYQNQIRRARGK